MRRILIYEIEDLYRSIHIRGASRWAARKGHRVTDEHGGTVEMSTENDFGEDFLYILRIADADIDGVRPIGMGLTNVKGIGRRTARRICQLSEIDPSKLGGHLDDSEQDRLRNTIDTYPSLVPGWLVNRERDLETNEDAHLFSLEVKLTRDDDIARLAEMKAYRGLRHRSGHKVRGQRLRSNGRSGLTLGVERKKV